MGNRRFQYDRAFEHYLRCNRIPYICVDEAKKALLPSPTGAYSFPYGDDGTANALKSFDFIVYSPEGNLLVDVKGRKCAAVREQRRRAGGGLTPDRLVSAPHGGSRKDEIGRLESWVTDDDVVSLGRWQELFGPGFRAEFVFIYLMASQPPDALFQEIFTFEDDWYAVRSISLDTYRQHMARRSLKWSTWWIPTAKFRDLSRPFDLHRLFRKQGALAADARTFLSARPA